MITSMTHVALTVADMDRSLKFYTQALGFPQVFELRHPDDGSPFIVYLNVAKGQFVELFYGGAVKKPWTSDLIGFNHLCFQVDDIHKAAKQVVDAGFQMDIEPNVGPDSNWQAWTTDPNGVRVELMQINAQSPHAQYM